MSLASLRECFSAPLEWIADKIKARPKATLMLWAASSLLVAWLF